uniref:Secreted peptide n=1 Tax=Oryza sativa subsp. japonica TaxID=39947 RepID=Q69QG1_ORYSJ|nr:hypothetical protein [Oryza sativa Japonica Group]
MKNRTASPLVVAVVLVIAVVAPPPLPAASAATGRLLLLVIIDAVRIRPVASHRAASACYWSPPRRWRR